MTQQMILPVTRIERDPNLWYDETHVYRLWYRVDANGKVYQKWRENVCAVDEWEGYQPWLDGQQLEMF